LIQKPIQRQSNALGEYIDTTPLIPYEVEYVIDVDISIFGQEHYEEIDNCIGASLWLRNGIFSTVEQDMYGFHVEPISELKTENLFNLETV